MGSAASPPGDASGRNWRCTIIILVALPGLVLLVNVFPRKTEPARASGRSTTTSGAPNECDDFTESLEPYKSEMTKGINWRFLCEARKAGLDKVLTHGYQYIYSKYMGHIRHQPIRLMEIGLGCDMGYGPGKSLALWRKLFPHASISFVEYNEACAEKFRTDIEEKSRGSLYGGSAGDKAVIDKVVADALNIGLYDVIIDDGGHNPTMQLDTLNGLWPVLMSGGIYVVEDVQPSYFSAKFSQYAPYGPTFMEWVPRMTQLLHCKSVGGDHFFSEAYKAKCKNATELEKQVLSIECMAEACVLVKR